MIFDGKQLLNRALVLSARNAARRFRRGGPGAGASKRNWAPLVLRWRKRRAIKQGMPAGSFVSLTNVASFPQFHFYFTQFFAQRGRRAAPSKPDLPLRIPGMQTIKSYKSPDLIRAAPRVSGAAGYRRRGPAGHRIEERANTKAGMQSESRYTAQTGAAAIMRSFLRRESTLFYRPGAGRKRIPPSAGETRTPLPSRTLPEFIFAGRSRNRGDRGPIPAARTRAETSGAVSSPREAPVRRTLSYQGEELVWRRVTRSAADHDERTDRRTSVDPPVRTEPSHAGVSQIASDISSAAAGAAAAAGRTITSFDPAMVDRLTDDIIRRVEKRARIERERRGIG